MSHRCYARLGFSIGLLLLVSGAVPTRCAVPPTGAEPVADHLECYRVHDSGNINGSVDIDSEHFGLSKDCRIRRARFICAPAVKTVIDTKVDPLLSVYGPPAAVDRICYEV